jgi:dienelactone hydrolase
MTRLRGFGRHSLAFVLLALGQTYAADRNTGSWDLASLARPPEVTWADARGPIRSLYYAGEAYRGHPTRVFAYYGAPDKAAGNLPGMVLVHGGGGWAFKEWVELWSKRGYAAIAMDLAGHGPSPERKRLPDGGPDQDDAAKFTDIARGIKEAWPYHAVANVIRAVSLIRSFPEVDPERVGITGISWGGYLTCIVAGLDERLKVAVPIYGCGFLNEDSAWIPTLAKMAPADRDLWVTQFDPSNYLPGCKMPMLFVNGTNDFAYPLGSYQKSYRLVKGPRTLCITVNMPHGHAEGWRPKEIGLFVDAVLRDGRPLARFDKVSRQCTRVLATFEATVPIKGASLHYTTDQGPWQKRTWQSRPLELRGKEIRCELPAEKRIVYFLTITDERGAVVSTEHEAL